MYNEISLNNSKHSTVKWLLKTICLQSYYRLATLKKNYIQNTIYHKVIYINLGCNFNKLAKWADKIYRHTK